MNASIMRKRLPPFGRPLLDMRLRSMVPTGHITIACGWRRGETFSPRVVVPPGEDPESFDFSFCAALECVVLSDTRERCDAVARAVSRYLPKLLLGVVRDPPSLVPYIRSDGERGVL